MTVRPEYESYIIRQMKDKRLKGFKSRVASSMTWEAAGRSSVGIFQLLRYLDRSVAYASVLP